MFDNMDLSGAQPTSPGRPPVDETSFVGCYVAIAAVVGIFLGGFVGFGIAFGAFYAPGFVGLVLRLATIALTIAVVVGVRHLLAKGPSHMSSPERHARMMRTHQAMQSIASIMPATGISIDHLMFFFRVKSLTGPNISIRYYLMLWWGILFIASVIPGALTGAIVLAANPPPTTPAQIDVAAASAVWNPPMGGNSWDTSAWEAAHRKEIVCGTRILEQSAPINADPWEPSAPTRSDLKTWLTRHGRAAVKC